MNNIANIDKYCCGKYTDFFYKKKEKEKKENKWIFEKF